MENKIESIDPWSKTIQSIQKLAVNDVCQAMNTRMSGLSSQEVEDASRIHGKNVITEKKGKPVILIFLANFVSLMAILLILIV